MIWFLFLLLTTASNVYEISAISSLDDKTCDIFLDLLKGKFNVPLKQRNNKQKSALVRFWRNCDHVSLKGGKVCWESWRALSVLGRRMSGRPHTEHSCLSPAQEELAQLDSASDINMKEDQSHNNIDQHAPDVSTTHRNRTGLHKN